MSISVFEFGALQSHWMLARWDTSVPRTLERLSVAVISVTVVADMYSVESSAYIDTLALLKASGMSLVKFEKSNGPRQLPWGIPESTWIMLERLPLNNTLCVLLDR